METFVNMAYEDLMHHYLFEPLQMTRSNFGQMGAGRPLITERCQYIWPMRDAEAQDPAGPGSDFNFMGKVAVVSPNRKIWKSRIPRLEFQLATFHKVLTLT